MSGLGWTLRRLSAMPASEVAHRARVGLRDRLRPPDYAGWTPAHAFERLFPGGASAALESSRLVRLAHPPQGPAGLEPVMDGARELADGGWSLFGRPVRLDDPPRWRRDYASGAEWPDLPSARIDYRSHAAGGAKYAWELGRLTFLPTLALAWRAGGDRTHADRAIRWLEDFTSANPLGRGIHHTQGIEMAVRVITTAWTLALLSGPPGRGASSWPGTADRLAPALGLLYQQALHCRDHLSLGSSANNHLISEYAAMAVAGGAFPSAREADRLLDQGLAGLERETLRQIHPDGVPAEQAFGYLPFVCELLLAGFLAAEAAGRPVSDAVKARLSASLEFARAVRLPGGRWPQVGDEDDGRILLALEGPSRLDLVGDALAAWLGADGLGGVQALARLLTGRDAGAERAAADGVHSFPHGGWTVWRSEGLLVTFDHGPLGLGPLAAHGHADALAITLHHRDTPIVVDPGTFAYQEDAAARERCRGTPGHATLSFGGRSQSRMLGPFQWGARASVAPSGNGYECRWTSGERHWRRVEVSGRTVRIEDRAEGREAGIEFTLDPAAQVQLDGARAVVTIGAKRAIFESEGLAPWRRAPWEYAPRFGTVVATAKLAAALTGSSCRISILVEG